MSDRVHRFFLHSTVPVLLSGIASSGAVAMWLSYQGIRLPVGWPIAFTLAAVAGIGLLRWDAARRRRLEDTLYGAQELAERLLETANTLVIGMSYDGTLRLFNATAERVTGYRRQDVVGHSFMEILVPQTCFPEVWRYFDIQERRWRFPEHNETPLLTRSGAVRVIAWLHGDLIEQGKAVGILSLGIDTTERRRAERLAQAERKLLQDLIDGAPLEQMLQTLAREAERQDPELLYAIGLVDAEQRQLHYGAAPSLPGALLRTLDGTAIDPQSSPCGAAAFRKQRVIVTDIATAPAWEGWRDVFLEHGLRACWSQPVLAGTGKVVATLTGYCRTARAPTDEELALVERFGYLASIAIEHWRIEEQVRKLSQAVEQSANAVFITNPQGLIEYVNPRFVEITGYTAAEVSGRNPGFLKSNRTPPGLHQDIWAAVREGREWHGEIYNRRKNGELYCCRESIYPVKDKSGKVTHFVAICEDISASKTAESIIENLAYYDPVTELPNRRLLADRLHQALAEARRDNKSLAVVCLDLDHFKNINDSLGHETGDQVLKGVGERLKTCIQDSDTIARSGGDEFILVCTNVPSITQVNALIKDIFCRLAEPFVFGDHKLHIRASIGIALYPSDGQDAGLLLMNVELAMYYAKYQGRNTYQYYTDEMNTRAYERMALENHLRHALEAGELKIHYQPRVDMNSQRIKGVEALVRWFHPEQGLIPPSRFIPLAEENGLIVPLGEWILEAACLQCRHWQSAGFKDLQVSINLSARQFRQQDLLSCILRILRSTGLDPSCLELELTETVVMENAAETIRTLQGLKDAGIRIAIDDFGTGYSSLSYLKRFPIDVLKIDRSFVRDVTTDANDAAIAGTIITMAHNLHLGVVAEGVETPEQMQFLRARGCHEAQGYLFSKPVPAEELEKLLRQDGRFPRLALA